MYFRNNVEKRLMSPNHFSQNKNRFIPSGRILKDVSIYKGAKTIERSGLRISRWFSYAQECGRIEVDVASMMKYGRWMKWWDEMIGVLCDTKRAV